MGPRADTRPPPRIGGTEADKHTLTEPDLICFNLQRKTRRIKGKQREGDEGGGSLFSQMKWKAHVAAICQTKQRFSVGSDYWGIFFFFAVTTQITQWKKRICGGGAGRQLSWGRWIFHERAHNFKNFYIYDAKQAPLPHTHSPLLKDN